MYHQKLGEIVTYVVAVLLDFCTIFDAPTEWVTMTSSMTHDIFIEVLVKLKEQFAQKPVFEQHFIGI